MRRCTYIFVLVGSTAMASSSAVAASKTMGSPTSPTSPASSAEVSSRTVRLSIDTSAMGKEAKSTRAWVLRDGSAALAEAGVEVIADAGTEIRVDIEPEDLGYTVTIEVHEGEAEAPSFTRGPKICESCTRTELVGLVGRELAWVGGWLSASGAEPSPALEGGADEAAADDMSEDADEPERTDTPTPAEPRHRKLHALGWSGIGVGALGLGTMVGGLAVVVRDYEARGERGNYRTPSVHPKRAGWAMVGLGAAALVGGSVMLVLDLVRGNQMSTAAAPWLGPGAGGLWVRRRF